MKELIKKIAPKWAINFYHLVLANLGALIYGFPSDKLIVIGVTGTKGKSTTSYLIAKLLEAAGYKVGLTSTIIFKIGKKEWLNDKKMTMLGRFGLQKMLREMVRAGVKYAVIETSSEGIAQHRNAGISYDVALFTNLSPEHLESHGSYDKYRAAKGKLFQGLAYGKKKEIPKTAVINLDDSEADYFLKLNSRNIGFTLNNSYKKSAKEIISAEAVVVKDDGSEFKISGVNFKTKLLGKFNVYNIVGALAVCKILGAKLANLKKAVATLDSVPGRMEFINEGQNFQVVVDYAHEPASLKALYSIVREMPHKRVIHIFGGTGGGRDRARRPVMGEIADQNSQIIILTNDDPYGEDEMKIISDIKKGIAKKKESESLYIIPDRKAAIVRGIGLAEAGDIVLITGKGCEQKMAIGSKMIPWDDRAIAREAIAKLKIKK
ncbi:MAG: UDP-N-acetylmuramoyl-L-alanyl-D-glutamate--2,6-diaminopimelate ligase [bacterium]